MIVLLTGGCKNGKSNTAQDIACSLRDKSGGGLYYVATMESTGKEDDYRIRKHVENRAGLGFETIEIARDIKRLSTEKEKFFKAADECKTNTFLVDSLTALLANEMFRVDKDGNFTEDSFATKRVCDDLRILCKEKDYNLIFVSDGIYSDAAVYDMSTEAYREGLALIERKVSEIADEVIEMCAGKAVLHKKGNGEMSDGENRGILIVGGAGQGKLEFAKQFIREVREIDDVGEGFDISDKDIYTFEHKEDCNDIAEAVPGGYKIYYHVERLVRGTDVSIDELSELFSKDAIVICEDITCGIVPVDAPDRKWREDAGRFMQALATNRTVYRVICGIGEKIG
ncbi:bifunctional adenosylcobinamide kinase/adenosylcobinamide-phosphate guanylyltransferase [Butyrivibrio sp. M55]|uniref:bifunctional adenosylcobinamide kinase/adenosylcobinamide-phosphate guanylyltransferase n=1 Tax=Butyrivibrio sp. M55 TaxID=1855323 RepID=UPI0008E3DEBB|nr:bifunctional adenosylcobinamide kinase/adenosylcobinamide-phosphate guanylyltransferase [Butyrivibrio sp. M55]SFU60638.1 adenosylcobinamide kinase /adenosylcobinamide-phosphate guanylyltransferase [Butyrivibrio sp. M55]